MTIDSDGEVFVSPCDNRICPSYGGCSGFEQRHDGQTRVLLLRGTVGSTGCEGSGGLKLG